jgi:hypothetical protein
MFCWLCNEVFWPVAYHRCDITTSRLVKVRFNHLRYIFRDSDLISLFHSFIFRKPSIECSREARLMLTDQCEKTDTTACRLRINENNIPNPNATSTFCCVNAKELGEQYGLPLDYSDTWCFKYTKIHLAKQNKHQPSVQVLAYRQDE